jgi:hypothetical protein
MPIVKWLGVALYAAVLVLAPFTHHDLVCHLKDPQHCTACTSNQVGTDPATLRAPRFRPLVDAGRAVQLHALATGVLLAAHSTGRSPPAFI